MDQAGASGREHAVADRGKGSGPAAQAHALVVVAPGQPGARAGPAKALCAAGQQAWDLKESFQHIWHYQSLPCAGAFLDYWCFRAMRNHLEPMKKVARMLRAREELLLNWF